jgi:predicted permease
MNLFGRSDRDYQEEIREHITLETQANIDRGMPPDEAARAARIAFGSVAGTRQQLSEGRPAYSTNALALDIRYALRAMRRNLLLSGAVVFTLSVGIGLTTAIFSLVNAVAFHPPVSTHSESFVMALRAYQPKLQRRVASVPVYERARAQTRSIRDLAAWSGQMRLSAPLGANDTGKVDGWLTSCNFFSVFNDEPPRLGRFLQEDDCTRALPVVVISEPVWRDRFGADSEIVGKAVLYGGHPMTVVGVAIPPKLVDESAAGLWVPYTSQPLLKDLSIFPLNRDWLRDESFEWLQVAGRLQPGFTREQAEAELNVLLEQKASPGSGPFPKTPVRLTDGSLWTIFPADMLWLFGAALAFPTLVMCIVCATTATLLLSRAVARRREMAVRLALGGGRARLLQMLLAESLLLSLAAAGLSIVFVFKLPPLILNVLSIANVPPLTLGPDWRVFCYLAFATILTAVLAGVTPALESLNTQLGESLKGRESFGRRRGGSRLRHALIGIQVALSMVLLVTALTLVRSEQRQSDLGFEAREVVYAELPQALARNSAGQKALATSLQSLAGIQSIAFADAVPSLYESSLTLEIPGQPSQEFLSAGVSPEYFRTLEIPILAGRTFTTADTDAAIVSQRFADRVFPRQNPVGQTLQVSQQERRLTIVGVARDRTDSATHMAAKDGSFIYQQAGRAPAAFLLVRFEGDTGTFSRALQSALRVNTAQVLSVRTIQSRLDERVAMLHSIEMLLLAMGALGLTLVLVGVYGVVSFSAAQRKRDFAIRVALGAGRRSVFGAVVAAGMRPIPIAVLAGGALSFAVLKIIKAEGLFPTARNSADPIPYIVAGAVLLVTICVALCLPARRAMSADPLDALREE